MKKCFFVKLIRYYKKEVKRRVIKKKKAEEAAKKTVNEIIEKLKTAKKNKENLEEK